ncbi:MAG TPA: MFS transporter [Anaerolineae bacterium]|nr:MFS transporter [Anaerolineae bacterium]
MNAAATTPAPRIHYGWVILAVSVPIVFGALGLARFGYSVILPSMQASLELSNAQAGGLATANLVGYLAFSIIGGALAARFGPRRIVATGLVLAGLGMALTGLAQAFLAAALWRALTGVGSGLSNVPVMGLLSAWFAARRRGLATGLAVTGVSFGLIAVGWLVPAILAAFGDDGWRLSWFLFGGVTLAIAALGYALLRDRPADKGLRPLGADATASALDPAPRPGSSAARPDGLQWGLVYRSPLAWHLGLVYSAFGFAYIIYITFFAKFLIAENGYTQPAAGSLFTTMGWFTLSSGLIWGMVSDAIGRKGAMLIVYLIQAVAIGMFGLKLAPLGLTLSAILFGLTAWSLPAIMAATCGDAFGSRLAPAALGFVTLFFGLGQAIGPSVVGAMADSTGTFTSGFMLAGFVSMLGAAGALFLRPTAARPEIVAQGGSG